MKIKSFIRISIGACVLVAGLIHLYASDVHAWGWKVAYDIDDARDFLNGEGAYTHPVTDAKICAVKFGNRVGFYIFYKWGPEPADGWGWKRSTCPDDVMNFLNGEGAYTHPVTKAEICAVNMGGWLEFFVFYKRESGVHSTAGWGWKKAMDPDDAINFINGREPYRPITHFEICAVRDYHAFFIFYKRESGAQAIENWTWRDLTDPDDIHNLLNDVGDHPSPEKDVKSLYQACAVIENNIPKFYIFKPEGFLIVTRPLFVTSLDDYINWKFSKGFEVSVVTAEWIQAHVEGDNLRIQIRNCIRNYYYNRCVQYALLIGDSIGVPYDPTNRFNMPEPLLNEQWNLPGGFYHVDFYGHYLTTLYYSDLTDKVNYSKAEKEYQGYQGDYKIYVGIMPVRTLTELQNILAKTLNYRPVSNYTFVFSDDWFGGETLQYLQELQLLAGAGISIDHLVFFAGSSAEDVYKALFETHGAVNVGSHGNSSGLKIGDIWIGNEDASKFRCINPLFMTNACWADAYQYEYLGEEYRGDCIKEAFLKARNGPVAILPEPSQEAPQGVVLPSQVKGFWKDLFAGKAVGQAMYDHFYGTRMNPMQLFGDPSLVVMKPDVLIPDDDQDGIPNACECF